MSLKTRFIIWRSHLAIPSLLGRGDERNVVSLIAAINGALSIATISLFAWFTDLPFVFPALGPTIFILCSSPLSPSAAPRSVIVGHLLGILSGYAAWHLVSFFAGAGTLNVNPWMICAPALALAMTAFLLIQFSCPHPPACASAMVIALGEITTWTGVLLIVAAVVWVCFQAVAINRMACLPVPLWSAKDVDSLLAPD